MPVQRQHSNPNVSRSSSPYSLEGGRSRNPSRSPRPSGGMAGSSHITGSRHGAHLVPPEPDFGFQGTCAQSSPYTPDIDIDDLMFPNRHRSRSDPGTAVPDAAEWTGWPAVITNAPMPPDLAAYSAGPWDLSGLGVSSINTSDALAPVMSDFTPGISGYRTPYRDNPVTGYDTYGLPRPHLQVCAPDQYDPRLPSHNSAPQSPRLGSPWDMYSDADHLAQHTLFDNASSAPLSTDVFGGLSPAPSGCSPSSAATGATYQWPLVPEFDQQLQSQAMVLGDMPPFAPHQIIPAQGTTALLGNLTRDCGVGSATSAQHPSAPKALDCFGTHGPDYALSARTAQRSAARHARTVELLERPPLQWLETSASKPSRSNEQMPSIDHAPSQVSDPRQAVSERGVIPSSSECILVGLTSGGRTGRAAWADCLVQKQTGRISNITLFVDPPDERRPTTTRVGPDQSSSVITVAIDVKLSSLTEKHPSLHVDMLCVSPVLGDYSDTADMTTTLPRQRRLVSDWIRDMSEAGAVAVALDAAGKQSRPMSVWNQSDLCTWAARHLTLMGGSVNQSSGSCKQLRFSPKGFSFKTGDEIKDAPSANYTLRFAASQKCLSQLAGRSIDLTGNSGEVAIAPIQPTTADRKLIERFSVGTLDPQQGSCCFPKVSIRMY